MEITKTAKKNTGTPHRIRMMELDDCKRETFPRQPQGYWTNFLQKLFARKPRHLILKVKNAEKHLPAINYITRHVPKIDLGVENRNALYAVFKKEKECAKFKYEIQTKYKGVKMIEEQDGNVEIVIDNVGDISDAILELAMKKLTGEKPQIIKVVKIVELEKCRVHLKLSGLGLLKLQALDESFITIGYFKSRYMQAPDWFESFHIGRETCYNIIE